MSTCECKNSVLVPLPPLSANVQMNLIIAGRIQEFQPPLVSTK